MQQRLENKQATPAKRIRLAKKLMALSASPNPHEAMLARSKALAILAKPGPVEKSERAQGRRTTFTDLGLSRIKAPPKGKQTLCWDTAQRGLSCLISSGGTRTFRSQFNLNGKWCTRSIGRLGENTTETGENFSVRRAREQCRQDRALAKEGKDPRIQALEVKRLAVANEMTVESAIDLFIEKRCKPRQRSFDQCRGFLKRAFIDHLRRPITTITSEDCEDILKELHDAGKHATGRVTLTNMRTMFRWLAGADRKIVDRGIMRYVADDIVFKKGKRERFYTDEEIVAIWRAAGKLDELECAYTRLMILLAPRATSLAMMQWAQLDQDMTLWTVPDDLTKRNKLAAPRTYRVPLPDAARKILLKLGQRRDGKGRARIFWSFPISWTEGERPSFESQTLKKHLKANGAPPGYRPHDHRHTLATWLENNSHDLYDRGLALNHTQGGVTAGYSHGFPHQRKKAVLDAWAAHVEKITK